MDASNAATLCSLKSLLDEFFAPITDNERKHQIEQLLNRFGLQDEAWIQCVYFLENSSNSYVQMYSLGILESIVNKRWHSFPGNDKQQIRKFIYSFIVVKYKDVEPFIYKKCIKVMMSIGRIDWPMFYPTFFSNIMQLVKDSATTIVGITALRMISEEFISPREDISMARRLELKEHLLQHAPTILYTLTEILNSFTHQYSTSTNTPPPSPKQSPNHRHVPLSLVKKLLGVVPVELCCSVFECLTEYISWLPLSQYITPTLVAEIFKFAEYGCSESAVNQQSIGKYALACVNEILSKKFIPYEYEAFLLQLFNQTCSLLQKLIKKIIHDPEQIMEHSYSEKFVEFLGLFVGNHMSRFETYIQPSDLLSMILKYTIIQDSHVLFLDCLDVLTGALDYLIDKITSCITSNFKLAAIQNYVGFLEEFLSDILMKVQYQYNKDWLEQLDMGELDSYDDDGESEWEKFMKVSLEAVGKLSEILPEDTLDRVLHLLKENSKVYFSLSNHISNNALLLSESERESLHSALKDLSTSFRLTGRLSILFTDEVNFQNRFDQAHTVFEHLLKGAMCGCYNKFYNLKCEEALTRDFLELHAQSVGALQAFNYWLVKVQSVVQGTPSRIEKYQQLMSSVFDVVCLTIDDQTPVQRAGAHLFVSMATTVRPSFFLRMKQSEKLFACLEQDFPHNISLLLYKGVSNSLVLPWFDTPSQEWDMRGKTHKSVVATLCKSLCGVPDDPSSVVGNEMDEISWKLKRTFSILTNMVDSVCNECMKSRSIMYTSVQEVVDLCLKLISSYISFTDTSEVMLNFLYTTVNVLKLQMGAAYVEKIINTLLQLLKKDQMMNILTNGITSGCNALEKFIKILQLVLRDPDPSFKKLLPGILTFSLHNLLPILNKNSVPELTVELLEMFKQLLLHNWRHFFKSDVISKMNGTDQLQNEDNFLLVLKAFGEPLLKNDISIFKKSLETLACVDEKHSLFKKGIFQSSMLSSFLEVLLRALIDRSHNLLQDEIIDTIYSMVTPNFDAYFNQFIPHFLMNLSGLSDHQKTQLHSNYNRQQDIPSFRISIQQLIGDLRYLQIVNSNIPSGSVRLV